MNAQPSRQVLRRLLAALLHGAPPSGTPPTPSQAAAAAAASTLGLHTSAAVSSVLAPAATLRAATVAARGLSLAAFPSRPAFTTSAHHHAQSNTPDSTTTTSAATSGSNPASGSSPASPGGPSTSQGGAGSPAPGAGAEGGEGGEPLRISLQDAVLRLAEAAVGKVEEGDVDGAIDILREGVNEFGPRFPNSPEVGELHSQAALLLNMQTKVDEAAHHAQVALDITQRAFGDGSLLTGHRMLRLGSIRVVQGQLSEAASLLTRALKCLGDDPSKAEAELYLQLIQLAGASDASQVRGLDSELSRSIEAMKHKFGVDSMVLSLAMSQHDRLVMQALAAQAPDVVMCEALLKQHIKLLEQMNPVSEDVAVAQYKLATFQYTQDLLHDAASHVKAATQLLRARYPEQHPLVVMCMHRLGMICAASGDHRAAVQLLNASRKAYAGEDGAEGAGAQGQGSAHGLAKEAELGLAMAKFRSIDPTLPRAKFAQQQQAALAQVRLLVEQLAAAIGGSHMLTQAGLRYLAQMSVMSKRAG